MMSYFYCTINVTSHFSFVRLCLEFNTVPQLSMYKSNAGDDADTGPNFCYTYDGTADLVSTIEGFLKTPSLPAPVRPFPLPVGADPPISDDRFEVRRTGSGDDMKLSEVKFVRRNVMIFDDIEVDHFTLTAPLSIDNNVAPIPDITSLRFEVR